MKKEKQILYTNPDLLERRIFLIRGVKVMLDSDLAELYEVDTKSLNRAVNRNIDRFPNDFCFKLNKQEIQNLRYQIGTSSSGYGGRRYLPYVFTEHGVAMLSSVLKSERAVIMSLFIIRAFVKLREMLATHKDLANKMEKLEMEQREQGEQLDVVYSIVKRLIDEPQKDKEPIGFNVD